MSRFLQEPVLGLETSGSLTGAALLLRGRLVGELSEDHRAGSSEALLDLVRRLLQTHGIRTRDLARVGVSLGPGSFTGLRVGLAAGRALALGSGVALCGVPSHQALAWPWAALERTCVLLTGLRRGFLYLEAGCFAGDEWQVELPAENLPETEVPGRIAGCEGAGRLLFLGEALESMGRTVEALARLGRVVRDPLACARRPAAVAFLAARPGARIARGEELDALAPIYLRAADARKPQAGGARRA